MKNIFLPYTSISCIEAAHKKLANGKFFTTEAKNFFNSIIYPEVYGNAFFVTSEKEGGIVWDGERRYTVRKAETDGTIKTISGFGEFKTKASAEKLALRLGRELKGWS